MLKRLLLLFFCFASFSLFSQVKVNQNYVINDTMILLDSGIISPNSIKVYHHDSAINFLFKNHPNRLILDNKYINQEIQVSYLKINFLSQNKYQKRSELLIEPEFNKKPDYFNMNNANNIAKPYSSGLKIDGNIGRSVGAGNNQDVVINSNLNLNLLGNLGKGIQILASISDENNPIQPEGNTQQIQDFDKVYISLFKDSNQLTLGDILMTNQLSYFQKYYKKSRGVQFHFEDTIHKNKCKINSEFAMSRGRFSRNEIQGNEGVQGPYRLSGVNNELNIIVISGTEVVYLNGKKMERGQQNDYIIDYNIGEIIFMPRNIINQFSRIVVEFQYSDRNYARSVLTVSNQWKFKNLSSNLSYFSEQDSRFRPNDTSNRSSINDILQNAGDNKILFNNERKQIEFSNERVMYLKKDSLGFEIYFHITKAANDSIFYSPTFSFVGNNKGNYIPVVSATNGRVYQWVKPENGIPQGSFEPIIELVAPNRNQMLIFNNRLKINSLNFLEFESAWSNFDKNTLSNLDKNNDNGVGLFLRYIQKPNANAKVKVSQNLMIEFASQNFRPIERYRSVEFSRKWNRQLSNSNISLTGNDIISTYQNELKFLKYFTTKTEFSNYQKGNDFKGYFGQLVQQYNNKNLTLEGFYEMLNTAQNTQKNLKNKAEKISLNALYIIKNHQLNLNSIKEYSHFKNDTASFLKESFEYWEHNLQLSHNSTFFNYQLNASNRTDYDFNTLKKKRTGEGNNVSLVISHLKQNGNRVGLTSNYRTFKSNLANALNEEIFLNRVEYSSTHYNKVLTQNFFYQIGNGREQRRQLSYTLVQPGMGTHQWVDYNGNGIEEINEFEIAAFSDQARYVRLFLPTNEFIRSNTLELNQMFKLQAPFNWQYNTNKWKNFISKWNTVSNFKIDRKITNNNLSVVMNPFEQNLNDTDLISINNIIKHSTFFNRTGTKFAMEHTITKQNSKQFINSGFDLREISKNQFSARYNFNKNFHIINVLEQQEKQNKNDFFDNRNFNYVLQSIQPTLYYQNQKGYRIGVSYTYSEGKNHKNYGNERAFIHQSSLDFRYFLLNKGNFDAKLSSINIKFNGNPNSPLGFDILNGLQTGQNITWNMNIGTKTKQNIQINISYNGRYNPKSPIVHIGRMEARYLF